MNMAGCNMDGVMDEAALRAESERIRAAQGYHEVEISCTGEAGLQQCSGNCKKNPGHQNFIAINNFSVEHLPSRYRSKEFVDLVRAASDLTCRLKVRGISKDRPDTWPGTDEPFPFSSFKGKNCTMTGTGWVSNVMKYTEEDQIDCTCDECRRPGTHSPAKNWAAIYIKTAGHVVYNDEEARGTKCQFFYDSPETDVNTVLTLTGRKAVYSEIYKDWTSMEYVTHDVELLDQFVKMWDRWYELYQNMWNKYADVNPDLCIVVSHPHGSRKQVSIGKWTNRNVVNEEPKVQDIKYSYNTPTCPGSSGAMVITLVKNKRDLSFFSPPLHSQGRPGNDNNSGTGIEVMSPPLPDLKSLKI